MSAYQMIPVPVSGDTQTSNLLVDLPGLWAMFRRRVRLFLSVLSLVVALVMIVTFQLTPKYDATARVILDVQDTQALDISAVVSGISPDAAMVETEVEIIRSRSMAERVAEKLDLFSVPEFNPDLRESREGFPKILPTQRKDRNDDPRLVHERVIDNVMDAISAEREGITYAIRITATSEDRERAADLANAFADQYIVEQLDQKFEAYTRVTSYLDSAVDEYRTKLRAAEEAVEKYRTENGLLSAEGTLLSEQQVSDLQAQLIVQEADLSEKRAKLASVNRRLSSGKNLDQISDVLASQVVATLRAKQADLARRRADLETRYGPRHPQMDNIRSEEADIQNQLDSEIARIVGRLQSDVDVARQRVNSLKASIDELRGGLSQDNQALVRLRELEREAQVSRRNYEQILERSQQVRLLEDVADADARIADAAALPVNPAFPNKMLNLILGVILGGALGGLSILIAEIFDNGIRTADDVERALDTNMISMVPQLGADKLTDDIKTPADYIVHKPLSSFAESYRTIRSALSLQSKESAEARVVALTSAVSGEGKTISAMCLGRIAALSGDKAIIIDCDLRRRVLSLQTEDPDGSDLGLAEVLSGKVPFKAAVRRDDQTDLDILAVSEDRSGAGDLFGTGRFAALLARLRDKYDLVILDTAPLTAVADTRIVVDHADAAVLCVRWKNTPVNVAKAARKVLAGLGTPLVGAVMTQVDMRAQGGYGFEGSYKYYAQHGKYYFD